MAQDNPFADLIPTQPQQQAPGVIYGRPKQPTPIELRREQRADTSEARAERADARAAAAADRAAAADERAAAAAERALTNGTEGERTAAFLATRVAGGMQDIKNVVSTNPDAASPELDATLFGGIFGRNVLNSADRQRVEAAQLDVLDAALTLGTGAAYTKEQLEGYRESYFPSYWDAPETIKDKENRLARLLESARVKAGASAPLIDQALGRAAANSDAPPALAPRGEGTRTVMAENAPETPFDAQQLAAFDAVISSGGTDEQIINLARSYGQTVNPEDVRAYLDYRKSGGTAAPQFIQDNTLTPEQQAEVDRRLQGSDMGGSLAVGLADTVTLGTADELGAGLDAAFGAGSGTFRERYNNELAINRGVQSQLSERDPGSYLTGQIAGGFVLPAAGARTPAQLARLGAAYGGAYGAGSANGGIGDRIAGGAAGAAVGGATGYGLARLGQAAAARFGGSGGPGGGSGGARADSRALMEAAQRQGVDVLPADTGGPFTRRLTSAAVQAPLSGGPIIRRSQQAADQFMGARDRIAAEVGNAVDPVDMGEAVGAAARGFSGRTSARGGALYDEAQRLAEGVRVDPERARQTLSQQIARMEQVPGGGAGLPEARQMLQNLEGNFTVQGIRDMRTEMFVSPELRGTPASNRLREIVNAAADDVAASLEAQGRGEAADAFRRADRYWRQRIETIDQTIQPIIGSARNPKSGEQIVQTLMTAGRTNSSRLTRFVQSLPADEQATLRATVISQLGKANAGTQNAEGTAFSVNQFLTHWNQLSPRAKDTLFRGEARDALNDLAKVAEGTREAQGYANRSNTGGAMFGNVGGWIGVGSVAPTTAALGAVGQMVTGRLLASPRFARWLARPAKSEQDLLQQARRLSQIASREPAIANDIIPLQQALQQTVQRSAAQEAPIDEPA